MSESRSTLKSGIMFLSIALVVNGMFSLVLFGALQTRAHHSIGLPDYDSGWVSISQGEVKNFTHNLNTVDALVYVTGKSELGSISQNRIGGDFDGTFQNGLRWYLLTNSTITVKRLDDDWGNYDQVRVMIWKIEPEGAVGGLWIPVDKLGLLTPYIGLTLTTIIATAITIAFFKRRKKQ